MSGAFSSIVNSKGDIDDFSLFCWRIFLKWLQEEFGKSRLILKQELVFEGMISWSAGRNAMPTFEVR
jgi:hypothetical protein